MTWSWVWVPNSNKRVWGGSVTRGENDAYPRLSDDCYEWLADRQGLCRDGSGPKWCMGPRDTGGQEILFRDQDLAMLFKLTWVGL